MLRALWGPLLITVASVAHAVLRLGDLPDPMPIHWGLQGDPDGWAPRGVAIMFGPCLTLLIPAIVVVAARLDPVGRLDVRAPGRLAAMTTSIAVFGLVVSGLVVEVACAPVPRLEGRWVLVAVGALFTVLAATLRGIPRNGVAGVRTPWSLASDDNWEATHRLAVPAMAIGGGVTVVAALLLPEAGALAVTFAALLGSVGLGFVPGLRAAFAKPS
jgi:uncharacterized membrane protein